MITGWKSITEHTGFSRNTLLKLMREDGFPLQYIATKPTTTDQAIQKWFEKRIEQAQPAK